MDLISALLAPPGLHRSRTADATPRKNAFITRMEMVYCTSMHNALAFSQKGGRAPDCDKLKKEPQIEVGDKESYPKRGAELRLAHNRRP